MGLVRKSIPLINFIHDKWFLEYQNNNEIAILKILMGGGGSSYYEP